MYTRLNEKHSLDLPKHCLNQSPRPPHTLHPKSKPILGPRRTGDGFEPLKHFSARRPRYQTSRSPKTKPETLNPS